MNNLFDNIPQNPEQELFSDLLKTADVRIERIVSRGHTAPETGWFDQEEGEWVLVLQGTALVEFEAKESIRLEAGDYLNIPAHSRHRVSWTDPEQNTVWLAVFYR